MSSNKGLNTIAIVIAIIAIAISGITLANSNLPEPEPSTQPISRKIYMNAIEPKGSTNIDSEPFPTDQLPSGGGYALKEPDQDGKWVVETYIWEPSVIVVYEGDTVELNILGINGKQHPSNLERYKESFNVERGKLTTFSFIADKAGTYRLSCGIHQPSMNGYLLVLPRV